MSQITQIEPCKLTELRGRPESIDFVKEREQRRLRRRDKGGQTVVVVVVASDVSGIDTNCPEQADDLRRNGGRNQEMKDDVAGATYENLSDDAARGSLQSKITTPAEKPRLAWALSIDGVCQTVKNVFHRRVSLSDSEERKLKSNNSNNVQNVDLTSQVDDDYRQSNDGIESPESSPEVKKRKRCFQPSVYRKNKRRKQKTLASLWFGGNSK